MDPARTAPGASARHPDAYAGRADRAATPQVRGLHAGGRPDLTTTSTPRVRGELVTPTGMCLLRALCETIGQPPPIGFVPVATGVLA